MSKQMFPSWRYGPDGQSAIFASEADIPAGWAEHPSAVRDAPAASALKKRGRPRAAETDQAAEDEAAFEEQF